MMREMSNMKSSVGMDLRPIIKLNDGTLRRQETGLPVLWFMMELPWNPDQAWGPFFHTATIP